MRQIRKQQNSEGFSVAAPQLPAMEAAQRILARDVGRDGALENVVLERLELRGESGVKIQGGRFLNVAASNTKFAKLRLLDALHHSCDWANSEWEQAKVDRSEFDGCRMTGFSAADARFENVRFSKCRMELSIFHR